MPRGEAGLIGGPLPRAGRLVLPAMRSASGTYRPVTERGSASLRSSPGDAEPLVAKGYGDAFEAATLETVLSGLGVGRVVVAGAQADACVRSTLDGAFVRGTTRPLSATPTQRTTTRRTGHCHQARSSLTPTWTGLTRRLQVGPPGRSRPRTSNFAGTSLTLKRRPVRESCPFGTGQARSADQPVTSRLGVGSAQGFS